MLDGLPVENLVEFEQWESVDVFGDAFLGSLLEKAAHGEVLYVSLKKGKCRGLQRVLQRL